MDKAKTIHIEADDSHKLIPVRVKEYDCFVDREGAIYNPGFVPHLYDQVISLEKDGWQGKYHRANWNKTIELLKQSNEESNKNA